MNFSDWFDPYNIEHIKAYEHLHNVGYWPKNFRPNDVKLDPHWEGLIKTKIINAWISKIDEFNKNICPTCKGYKSQKSKLCRKCNSRKMTTENKIRLGTGKDWHVGKYGGYVYKTINGDHVYQHRYIMEQHLGRKLRNDEHMHHIDGDITNNNIENLKLMTEKEHHQLHSDPERMKEISKKGHKVRWGYEDVSDL